MPNTSLQTPERSFGLLTTTTFTALRPLISQKGDAAEGKGECQYHHKEFDGHYHRKHKTEAKCDESIAYAAEILSSHLNTASMQLFQ
jgi:hypothetical protein